MKGRRVALSRVLKASLIVLVTFVVWRVEGEAAANPTPGVLRRRAVDLRRAAARCRDRVASGELVACSVRLPWEGDRQASIGEAETLAVTFGRAALAGAIALTEPEPCNYFVSDVGQALDVPYFRDRVDDERLADQMYQFISGATSSRASGWRRVGEEEAQEFAERGQFVVAVARGYSGHPGHVAVAVPAGFTVDPNNIGLHLPWVRDGQHPHASQKASGRFGTTVSAPIWAVWVGEDQ
jgi:hypothetical protein